ncbi:MAG: TerB family tellurite resistance protein [Halomonas sp.]|uniref:tellurite resistance TerB family protein n=1 Tax=Halomonas sp. TaxID=1486246 RepID=UPI0019DB746A|nr:TerB family tellurite resistance protein [Halomonas sp.]MBE0488178.1 TerB family tellurite resistance protein [Halomonas sp.]
MLTAIQRFFQQVLADPEAQGEEGPTLELAAAALLCEVMRADYQEDPAQLVALREMLRESLDLEDEAVDELVALAREEVESSVDHYQFVSLIKQHYDCPRRCALVRMMWELALADGEHHHLEEHRIRQLADLLHVGHGDFIRAKLQAQVACD